MAEGQGFEPWMGVNPCRFSRPVHSTTLPSLLKLCKPEDGGLSVHDFLAIFIFPCLEEMFERPEFCLHT